MITMNTKLFNKYNPNASDIPGFGITLEDFDSFEDVYDFSDNYMKKKEELLNHLSDTPKSHIFHYKPYQIAAAFFLAFIILPTTCYAAVRYYKVNIQKEHYQTDIIVTPDTDTTSSPDKKNENSAEKFDFKPVKLVFNYLPAGSTTSPGDDSKYYVPSDEDAAAHGISPILNKLDSDEDMIFSTLSSLSTMEFMAGENPAYLVKKDSSFAYDKMLYVIFEKEHYLVEAYLGFEITEEEAKKIAAGIESRITEQDKLPSSYYKTGEVLPCSDLYPDCKVSVEKVEFFDSINGFDQKYFSSPEDISTFADDSGKLKTYDRNKWFYGDGITTLDKIIDTQTVGRKFVYVTVNVTNSSDRDENDFSAYNRLMFINETEDGRLEIAEDNYNYDNQYFEPQYFDASSSNNTSKSFFFTKIPAGETITYHVGYFIDDDLTDNIFFQAYYGESYGAEDSDYSLTDIRENSAK